MTAGGSARYSFTCTNAMLGPNRRERRGARLAARVGIDNLSYGEIT